MKRATFSAALLSLLVVSCSGGPSSPPAPSAPAIDVKQPAGPPLDAAVLADCLRAPQDSICSSGLRRAERAVVSGAIAPGAPGNLTATVTGSSVALAWNAPTSGDAVVSYVIEAGSTSGASNLANLLTNSTATSYLATGVGQGTYFVRMRAAERCGNGRGVE